MIAVPADRIKEAMRLYPRCGASDGEPSRSASLGDTGCRRVQTSSFCSGARSATALFSDPDRFDPERWREDPVRSGKIPVCVFPFGGGPRVCVGASFAMMEITLLLAMIQQRFHLEIVPGIS